MPQEFEIEMSDLSQKATGHNKDYDIDIYRGDHGGWILEVIDESGTSTVWDDEFDTDQAALDEALASIKRGDIEEGSDNVVPFRHKPKD